MNSSPLTTLRRRSAIALGAAALLGAATLSGCDSAGSDVESAVAGEPASPTASSEPTEEATEDPTDDSTDSPAPGGPITAAEYTDDWNFQLGDVKLSATHVRGTDYPSCAQLEVKNSLTSRGCDYGVKVTYRSKDGSMMFTHMILEMRNEKKATTFSHDTTLKYSDFNYGEGDVVPNFENGQWRARSAGKYVVFTICTGDDSTTLKQVKQTLQYANSDFTTALLWR